MTNFLRTKNVLLILTGLIGITAAIIMLPPTAQAITKPNVAITKTVDKPTANEGDTLTYTIMVKNKGDNPANGFIVTDRLPDNTTLVASSLPKDTIVSSSNKDYTWNISSISAGKSASITYSVTVNDKLPPDTTTIITNTANLLCPTPSLTLCKNSFAIATTKIVVPTLPLTITKTVDRTFANPGNTVTYTVIVNNNGTKTATNLILTDTLPTGFIFTDTGTTTATWKLGDLAAKKSITKSYTVKLDTALLAGAYDNVVIVTADNATTQTARVALQIKEIKVLGAEDEIQPVSDELPDTGASLLGVFSGVLLIVSGVLLNRKIK